MAQTNVGSRPAGQNPPLVCPRCGNHRTEVVGTTEAPDTRVIRCNSCGGRSVVPAGGHADVGAIGDVTDVANAGVRDNVTIELDVIQAISRALDQLPDVDAQRRVVSWINDRFADRFPAKTRSRSAPRPRKPSRPAGDGPSAPKRLIGRGADLDGLADFFDPPGLTMHYEAVERVQPRLRSVARGLVARLQDVASEWRGRRREIVMAISR